MGMQSALSFNRVLGFWTHESEYTLRGPLADKQLPMLVAACLSNFLPLAVFQNSTVQDLRGCGPQTLLDGQNCSVDKTSSIEELVHISGEVLPPTSDEELPEEIQDSDKETPQKFELQLHTKFDRFTAHHIIHRLVSLRRGDLPEEIGWLEIGSAQNVSCNHFRIGLEVFHEKLRGAVLAPIGDERLFLEADPKHFNLLLGAESVEHRRDLPLMSGGLINRLCSVFQELFGFDLKADFLRLVENAQSRSAVLVSVEKDNRYQSNNRN